MPKVLLLDTEDHIADILKRKFELEGFEVLIANSVQPYTGVDLVEPDLIIIGKSIDGAEDLPSASLSSDKTVPIIMLTSTINKISNGPEGLKKDVAQLQMPFRPSQLMAMAKQAVALV